MTGIQEKPNILILDDDPVYRRLSASILKEKFNVFTAEKPSEGFKLMKTQSFSFLILDYILPEMDGIKVLEKVKKEYPETEVVLISNSGNMDTVIEALRKGASDYFKKPFTPADIWMSIERTIKLSGLKTELNQQKRANTILKQDIHKEIGSIIGQSKEIKEVIDQINMVAQTPDTSVLIIGESGTGKELVARAIHDKSPRSNEVFGAANMSAIPDSLFESEFFGHVKGSFTDAYADKAGWFETANKGTLFLDEIGEMSMGLQVKLLRVLEDRKTIKVGTQKSLPFDIRIVSATNKNLDILTDGTSFRLDLFHRLGTFVVHLPPLRDRKTDIPILANHFLQMMNQKMGRDIKRIHPDVINLFMKYPFPGNIRELRNIMERAVIICRGDELKTEHFMLHTPKINANQAEIFDLEELEKRTIIRALEKTNYNKAEASKLLNIQWNALYRRTIKYGIDMPLD